MNRAWRRHRSQGQAALGYVVLGLVLTLTLFGADWTQAEGGALATLWQAFQRGFERFAAGVALP